MCATEHHKLSHDTRLIVFRKAQKSNGTVLKQIQALSGIDLTEKLPCSSSPLSNTYRIHFINSTIT